MKISIKKIVCVSIGFCILSLSLYFHPTYLFNLHSMKNAFQTHFMQCHDDDLNLFFFFVRFSFIYMGMRSNILWFIEIDLYAHQFLCQLHSFIFSILCVCVWASQCTLGGVYFDGCWWCDVMKHHFMRIYKCLGFHLLCIQREIVHHKIASRLRWTLIYCKQKCVLFLVINFVEEILQSEAILKVICEGRKSLEYHDLLSRV